MSTEQHASPAIARLLTLKIMQNQSKPISHRHDCLLFLEKSSRFYRTLESCKNLEALVTYIFVNYTHTIFFKLRYLYWKDWKQLRQYLWPAIKNWYMNKVDNLFFHSRSDCNLLAQDKSQWDIRMAVCTVERELAKFLGH